MEEKNKYNQCLLLNGYEFLDFENTKNTTLKEWLKDENFLLFIKSIPKDYIFIIKNFKNIKENHSFEIYKLLRIDFNVLINCHSVQEVIEKSLNTKINFNLNKFDIHLALSFAISLNFIAKNEQNKLYKFVLENNKLIYDY
ncbi:hypothetical protein D0753_08355, partial [Campylobacter coli]|nr:hypothetical protein [Campylobacter coli]